jgi:hypothetical protein
VDDPSDYLPASFEPANLVLSLGEVAGLAQLIPDIVRMTRAQAVIAPIDRNESVPPGLVRQLQAWLQELGATAVFPKPFCSLTEETINRTPLVEGYDHPLVRQFAAYFGKPAFEFEVDEGRIREARVVRDAACGCARHVAEGLVGTPVDEAVEAAGMLHHHYPCLASMNQDPDYHDTLMHVSGDFVREAVKDQLRPHLAPIPYLRPVGRVDVEED